MARYVSHARSVEELRAEFLSDIQRRLDALDSGLKTLRPNAAEAARIARVRMELLNLGDYWKEIQLASGEDNSTPIPINLPIGREKSA